jgi:hypothetical protein
MMRTLIVALLMALGLALPALAQGRLSVDSVIAWLPPNIETLIVAKGQIYLTRRSAGPFRSRQLLPIWRLSAYHSPVRQTSSNHCMARTCILLSKARATLADRTVLGSRRMTGATSPYSSRSMRHSSTNSFALSKLKATASWKSRV